MVALLISKMQPELLKKCNQTINPLLGTGFMVAFFSKQKVQPKVQPLSNRTQKSATNTVLPKKVQPKSATKR